MKAWKEAWRSGLTKRVRVRVSVMIGRDVHTITVGQAKRLAKMIDRAVEKKVRAP